MTTSNWQTSLVAQGANFVDHAVMQFDDADAELKALENTNILCDLSHLGLLQLNGEDRVSFLQGQVTNDVTLLTGKNAHLSGYCNPKGRMLALFLAFAHHDHLHLQLNRELCEPILQRLKMYVMRAKVDIKDVSDSVIKLGINGPQAAQLLKPIFSDIPVQDNALVSLENAAILKLPSIAGHARFEIFTDEINAPLIWNALKVACKLVGKPCWDWLDIQAGIPDVALKTQAQFVPQMLNLDILNGINFKKGCYTGQEIVARTHYLGKVKRRTLLANVAGSCAPKAGEEIKNAQQEVIGMIVRCAPSPVSGFDVLAELRLDQIDLTMQDTAQIYCNAAKLTLNTKNVELLTANA